MDVITNFKHMKKIKQKKIHFVAPPLIDNKITTYTYFKNTFCFNCKHSIDQQNTMNLKNVQPFRTYDKIINNI